MAIKHYPISEHRAICGGKVRYPNYSVVNDSYAQARQATCKGCRVKLDAIDAIVAKLDRILGSPADAR